MARKPETIDEYLESLDPEKRAALQRLRRIIKSAVPEAEECISYRIPAFRLRGKMLVWFGAASSHCALYPGSRPIEARRDALRAYSASKGTIRFQPDRPLPEALVKRLLRAAIAARIAPKRESTRRTMRRR